MIQLPNKWGRVLFDIPEKGMGYWIVDIHMSTGQILRNCRIVGDLITDVDGKEPTLNPIDIIDMKLSEKRKR